MNKDMEKLFAHINKTYGADTIKVLTKDFIPEVKVHSSGSLTLDLALGRGGIADGRIIEVFGPQMAGKTTVCLLHIAEVQRAGGLCAFIDAEHTFDAKLASEYGVQLDKLVYINPKTAENAIDTAEALIRSGQFRRIVIDSVPALVPTKVIEASIEQQTMAILARFMGVVVQKLTGIAYEHDCSVIFINQLRDKLGGFSPNGGTPEITPGGRALPFASSVRMNVRMGDQIKVKDEVIGHWIKIKIAKNKLAAPFKQATFPLIYGVGVDRVYEIVELSSLAGIIKQGGAWFSYRDDSDNIVERDGIVYRWQGRGALTEFVRHNPIFLAELEEILRGAKIEAPTGTPVDPDGYDIEEEPPVDKVE